MDTLPQELLAAITDYCDHATLKNLRFVNSKLHDASSPLVFRHFFMAFFDESLDKLKALANSRHAKHVRKFTFFTDPLPVCDDVMYKTFAQGFALDEAKISESLLEYRRLQKQQHEWSRDIQGASMKESLCRLTNLVEVKTIAQLPSIMDANPCPVWKRIRERLLVLPENSSSVPAWQCLRVTLWLLEAIAHRASAATTKRQVENLVLRSNGFQTFTSLLEMYKLPIPHADVVTTALQNITDSFRHLSHVEIRHGPGVSTMRQWRSQGPLFIGENELRVAEQIAEEMGSFLQGAQQLTSLTTDGESITTWARATAILQANAPGESVREFLPSLRNLNLSLPLPVETDDLLDFIAMFKDTLRSLDIRGLLTDDAERLLEAIPRVAPNLEVIRIRGMKQVAPGSPTPSLYLPPWVLEDSEVDQPYERGIREYLLGRSRELPLLRGVV